MRCRLFACLLAAPALAFGGAVARLDVAHENGLYRLAMDARVEASDAKVCAILLDCERLNQPIKEVVLLPTGSERPRRMPRAVRACFLFFCKEMTQVRDVEKLPDSGIVVMMIPEQSDFRYGEIRWRILAEDQGVRLHFTADPSSAFWIPPLIGSLVTQHKLRKEAPRTTRVLEALAARPKSS